jgi:hypothetical protein
MNINDLIDLAERLESLSRRAETFGKTKEDLLEELGYIATDLRSQADRIDQDMAAQAEQYEIA